MQRREALVLSAIALSPSPCVADVPVADAPREGTEANIRDCMTKARVSKQATLQPSQTITSSVKTPGQGALARSGGDNISGAGISAPSNGVVSGIDLSTVQTTVTGGGPSVTSLNLNAIAQTVSALAAAANGLQTNRANTDAARSVIGAMFESQSAWNQNSYARTNNGALWNQVIMLSTLTAQLVNQRGVNLIGGASRAANALTFDPMKATFVGLPAKTDTNAIVSPRASAN
jgi:hypothetical protein